MATIFFVERGESKKRQKREKREKRERCFFFRDFVRHNTVRTNFGQSKKIHERVNIDERRNARAREKSLLERREKQSQTLVVVLFHFFLQNLHVVVLQTKHRLWWITTETRR